MFRRETAGDGGESLPSNVSRSVALIAKETRVEGAIYGSGELRVDGIVEGRIAFDGLVVVSPGAEVRGPLEARIVRVAGSVTGSVRGKERVEILATGRLEGNVSSPRVAVSEGAFLKGEVEMSVEEAAAPATDKLQR